MQVDAALDPTNVSKLARYIGTQSAKGVQFLIISLKSALYVILDFYHKSGASERSLTPFLSIRYEHADGLVGVYREQEENSSRTLSLDLRKVSRVWYVEVVIHVARLIADYMCSMRSSVKQRRRLKVMAKVPRRGCDGCGLRCSALSSPSCRLMGMCV